MFSVEAKSGSRSGGTVTAFRCIGVNPGLPTGDQSPSLITRWEPEKHKLSTGT